MTSRKVTQWGKRETFLLSDLCCSSLQVRLLCQFIRHVCGDTGTARMFVCFSACFCLKNECLHQVPVMITCTLCSIQPLAITSLSCRDQHVPADIDGEASYPPDRPIVEHVTDMEQNTSVYA